MKKSSAVILIIVVAVLGLGVGFYGGFKYGQSTNASRTLAYGGNGGGASGTARFGGNRSRAGGNGNIFINGTVVSKDAASMTVSLEQGGSQVVFFSPSTTIDKTTLGSTSDLTAGAQVMVIGTENSDGTAMANSIQLRSAAVGNGGVMGAPRQPVPTPAQ